MRASATTPFLCNSCFLRNIPKFIWMNGSSMLGITVPLTNCHWPLVCTLRVPDVIYDPWLWRRKINNRRKGSLGNFFEYVVFFMPILEKCCASSLALIVSCSNVLHSLDLCKVMLELLQEVRLWSRACTVSMGWIALLIAIQHQAIYLPIWSNDVTDGCCMPFLSCLAFLLGSIYSIAVMAHCRSHGYAYTTVNCLFTLYPW